MKKKILVVDDSSAMRNSVMFAVEQSGYEAAEAKNGREALERLRELRPDLIICDVNMPVMDGIEMLRALKGDDAYAPHRFVPVLMLTTESDSAMIEKGKKEGARAWMLKPFEPQKLLSSVRMLIG